MAHAQQSTTHAPIDIMARLKDWTFPLLILAMFALFAAFEPKILTTRNMFNILNQSAYLVVFALAQTLVLIPRGFDLSLGNAVSFISVATALALTNPALADASPFVIVAFGLVTGLGCGLAVGAFNGFFAPFLGIRAFIVTLGSMNICYGLSSTISGGRPVFNISEPFVDFLYAGNILGIPAPIIWAGLCCLLVHFILSRSVFGRILYLIGSNDRAAEVAGINARKYAALAYCIAGLMVGFGAMLLTARTGTGEPNLGGNLLLQAIAAAVMGGVSLAGGRGGVLQAMMGALFITVLSNGLNFLHVSGYLQQIVLGVVIIIAIAIDKGREHH